MESISQVGTVLFVLMLLGATLYWLRRKGFASMSLKSLHRGAERRMQSIERLSLAPNHSLHLVAVGGRVLLIGVSPGGCAVLDGDCKGLQN